MTIDKEVKMTEVAAKGFAKLTLSGQSVLKSWGFDVRYYTDLGEAENVSEARGKIGGYLNAMVHLNVLGAAEAIELCRCFTRIEE